MSGSAAPQPRSAGAKPRAEIEQMARRLGAALSQASAHATLGWSPQTPDSALPSSQHSTSSSASADSVDTVLTAVDPGVMDDGLGLSLKPSEAARPRALHSARPALAEPAHPGLGRLNSSSPSPAGAGFSTPSRSGKKPDLYAVVLGEVGLPPLTPPPSGRSSKHSGEPQRGEPTTPSRSARAGSSMKLHAMASSPQLGSSARAGGSGALPPLFDPHNDSAPPSSRKRTPSAAFSPTHDRKRSITAGRLANGHAATPLAYNLGLALGAPGARTVVPQEALAHARSASSTPRMGQASLADTAEQRETDRLAASLVKAQHRCSSALETPPRAASSGGAAVRDNGTFALPITPRRARNSNAGLPDSAPQARTRVLTTEGLVSAAISAPTDDESEAAHVLFSLAHSPSPQLASHARFAGATPSLSGPQSRRSSGIATQHPSVARRLFPDDGDKSAGAGLAMFGLGLAPAADVEEKDGSPARRVPFLPAGLEGEAAKLRLADGRSPPPTPPGSDLLPSRKRLGSSSPADSHGDAPSLERTVSSDSDAYSPPSSPSPAARRRARSRKPTTPTRQIASATPRTPPPAPGPKAADEYTPGTQQMMRRFINNSPSPRPSNGRFSPLPRHTPQLAGSSSSDEDDSDDDAMAPVATPQQLRTPLGRSSARFPGPPSEGLRELTASPMTPHPSLAFRSPHDEDGPRSHKRRRTSSRRED